MKQERENIIVVGWPDTEGFILSLCVFENIYNKI